MAADVRQMQGELNEWLKSVKQWQLSNPTCFSIQNGELCRLASFLQQLWDYFVSKGCVNAVVGDLPQAGQLLGRLCSVSAVLAHADCCSALIQCLLYYISPGVFTQSSLEAHAKKWALKQLQSVISRQAQWPSIQVQELIGATSCQISQLTLDQIEQILSQQLLQTSVPHCSEKLISCGEHSEPSSSVLSACRACLNVYTCQQKLGGLLSTLLKKLAHWPSSPDVISLYEHITTLQKKSLSDEALVLPYEAQLSVWLGYAPALEQTVMDLVHYVCYVTRLSTISLKGAILKLHLGHACAEHPTIYNMVSTLISGLLCKSKGHPRLFKLLVCLHEDVKKQSIPPEVSHETLSWPVHLQPCHHLLRVSLTSLSEHHCYKHMATLGQTLEHVLEDDTTDNRQLWLLMLQYHNYYWLAQVTTLMTDKEMVASSVRVASFCSQGSLVIANQACELVMCLRQFTARQCVSVADLHDSLTTLEAVGSSSGHPPPLLFCHSLLMFIMLFPTTDDVETFILQLVTNTKDQTVWLEELVEVLQCILDIKCSWLKYKLCTSSVGSLLKELISIVRASMNLKVNLQEKNTKVPLERNISNIMPHETDTQQLLEEADILLSELSS